MMCFEADLQVVRASSADGEGLNASRWALAEAAIIADIGAAVEEELDSGDQYSDGADDGPDSGDEQPVPGQSEFLEYRKYTRGADIQWQFDQAAFEERDASP